MTGLRRLGRRLGITVVGLPVAAAAVWAGMRAPWAENLTFLGGVVLVAPAYGAVFWLVCNRGRVIDRAHETSDEANRALSLAEEANHHAGQAYDKVREVVGYLHAQERPQMAEERPESRLDGLTAATRVDTNPLKLRAQRLTQPVTTPRPAVTAIPGGARLADKPPDPLDEFRQWCDDLLRDQRWEGAQ